MSVGMTAKVNSIYFGSTYYTSYSDMVHQREEAEKNLTWCKEKIKMMCVADMNKAWPDVRDVIQEVHETIEEMFEWMHDLYWTIHKTYMIDSLIDDLLYGPSQVPKMTREEAFKQIMEDPYKEVKEEIQNNKTNV